MERNTFDVGIIPVPHLYGLSDERLFASFHCIFPAIRIALGRCPLLARANNVTRVPDAWRLEYFKAHFNSLKRAQKRLKTQT